MEGDIEDLYLQSDANEINVKDINLANTKVISFATHGLVNGEIKGLTEPALVLTPPDNISDKNDGLLKSSEIALLDLNAEEHSEILELFNADQFISTNNSNYDAIKDTAEALGIIK